MNILPYLPRDQGSVRIRRTRLEDADAFARGSEDQDVRRFGHLPLEHYTPDVVRQQVQGPIDDGLYDGSLAVLAIADPPSDDFLGSIVLFDVRDDHAEVGFWLAPWARGRGVATESLLAVCRLAAATGLRTLDAKTSPENISSRRVLERAGFEQVGHPRTTKAPSGREGIAVTFERSLVDFRVNV